MDGVYSLQKVGFCVQKRDSVSNFRLLSAHRLNCMLFSLLPLGANGEQEDEEAFLESITNPSGGMLPQLALKVRLQSSPVWSHPLMLKPGQHQAGLLCFTFC